MLHKLHDIADVHLKLVSDNAKGILSNSMVCCCFFITLFYFIKLSFRTNRNTLCRCNLYIISLFLRIETSLFDSESMSGKY